MFFLLFFFYIVFVRTRNSCATDAEHRYVPDITNMVTIIPLHPIFLKSSQSLPIPIPTYARNTVHIDIKSTLDT